MTSTSTERNTAAVPESLAALGVTYRELDYWARKGHIHPLHDGGSGFCRWWPNDELRVAALIARLRRAGLALEVASAIARQAVEHDTRTHDLAPGITVTLEASA